MAWFAKLLLFLLSWTSIWFLCDAFVLSDHPIENDEDAEISNTTWYLSSNGTDSTTCGKTMKNACKTLDYVLGTYYNTTHSPENELHIVTSESLSMDQLTQIKYPQLRSSKLRISSYIAVADFPTVSICNFDFLQSKWQFIDLNVEISNCDSSLLTLIVSSLVLKKNKQYVKIQDSSFGRWAFENVTRIWIENCTSANKATLLFVNSSAALDNINVQSSYFDDDLLKVVNSSVLLRNSKFGHNKLNDTASLVEVWDGSEITILNCEFQSNSGQLCGTVLHVDQSNLVIEDCSFVNNSAPFGGVMCAYYYSLLQITNSIFIDNAAMQGGVLNFQPSGVTCILTNTTFLRNRVFNMETELHNIKSLNAKAHEFHPSLLDTSMDRTDVDNSLYNSTKASSLKNVEVNPTGGAIGCKYNCTLIIYNSTFSSNSAESPMAIGGAISSLYNCTVKIQDSTFTSNVVKSDYAMETLGGAISVNTIGRLSVHHSTFVGNQGLYAAAIDASGYVEVEISHSTFSGNKVGFGAVTCFFFCELRLEFSVFVNNNAQGGGGGIVVSTNSTVEIAESQFNNNSAFSDGGVIIVKPPSTVIIHNSSMSGNYATYSGGAVSIRNVVGKITTPNMLKVVNSTFTENKSDGTGGAIEAGTFSNVTLDNALFNGNSALGDGGSLHCMHSSTLYIQNSTFTNSSSERGSGGGVHLSTDGKLQLYSSFFEDNQAKYSGGSVCINDNSSLTVTDTMFDSNKAGLSGGALTSSKSALEVQNNTFYNNSAGEKGGAVSLTQSVITIRSSLISCNSAYAAGAIFISDHSLFISINSTFENNTCLKHGGCIGTTDKSEICCDNCTFIRNRAETGGAIDVSDSKLRISKSVFVDNEAKGGRDMFYSSEPADLELFTYGSIISHNGRNISSRDEQFVTKVQDDNSIYVLAGDLTVEETPYAAVVPKVCLYGCSCYYYPSHKANVFDCEAKNISYFPDHVPNNTDWLKLRGNNIQEMNKVQTYMETINFLDISSNNLSSICIKVIETLLDNLGVLNISNNSFTTLPSKIAKTDNVTELWISENPYECNCDMLWMRDWLVKATNVMDKENVTCGNGKMKGEAIYKLDVKTMGCIFPVWGIVTIAGGSLSIVFIVILLNRKWETIKFCMFAHFNVLTDDDGPENLNEMDFDGFLTYSHPDRQFVKANVVEYLENESGLKLCIHERDFLGGGAITANIAAAIEHSRRMIMMISRNYINSGWCMEEFRIAHQQVINGRKNFLIPVLLEDVNIEDLDADLKMYIETHTYIETTDLVMMKKRLRFAMPHVPLANCRPNTGIQQDDAPGEDEEGAAAAAAGDPYEPVTMYGGVSHVDTIAKRIAQGNKPKHARPASPLGGDFETSSSDDNDDDDQDDDLAPLVA